MSSGRRLCSVLGRRPEASAASLHCWMLPLAGRTEILALTATQSQTSPTKRIVMPKSSHVRTLLLATLLLSLAVGCATHRDAAGYGAGPTSWVTSGAASAAAQREADSAFYAPPAGASPTDWAVANQIRWLLCSDHSLPSGSVAISVQAGRVHIDEAPSESAQMRLAQAIAALPGVKEIDNPQTAKHF